MKRNLRAVIFRSISPRFKESAHIPDLIWKVSFLGAGLDDVKDVCSTLFVMFCWGTVVADSEWDVKSPKESDSSKLFNGTAANGSNVFVFVCSEVEDFVSGAAKGSNVAMLFGSEAEYFISESKPESDAPNKSTVAEAGAGWLAKKSMLAYSSIEYRALGLGHQIIVLKSTKPD